MVLQSNIKIGISTIFLGLIFIALCFYILESSILQMMLFVVSIFALIPFGILIFVWGLIQKNLKNEIHFDRKSLTIIGLILIITGILFFTIESNIYYNSYSTRAFLQIITALIFLPLGFFSIIYGYYKTANKNEQ